MNPAGVQADIVDPILPFPGEGIISEGVRRILITLGVCFLLGGAGGATPAREGGAPIIAPAAALVESAEVSEPRPVESVLEAQVELHRRGFSCGSIDGVMGAQTAAALRAWQRSTGIRETGTLDAATRQGLLLVGVATIQHVVTAADIEAVGVLPQTWLEKSQLAVLAHETVQELIAERYRASPKLLERLNPEIDWQALAAGAAITVPAVEQATISGHVAQVVIKLEARELELLDVDARVIGHCPVSIARRVEKRPVGELKVQVVIREPNYTFDPEVFNDVPEAKELGRKLIISPGPNNPVGRAWIGLDLPGYGIHGTPDPEKIGRTESRGCFRLANWDALTMTEVLRVGMVVVVEP